MACAAARELAIKSRTTAVSAARPNAAVMIANETPPATTKPSAVVPTATPTLCIELFQETTLALWLESADERKVCWLEVKAPPHMNHSPSNVSATHTWPVVITTTAHGMNT